jgi:hypothetical protein
VVLGAAVLLFGGLSKLVLEFSNSRSKRYLQSKQDRVIEPLVIQGMQMPSDDWTYHPPPRR